MVSDLGPKPSANTDDLANVIPWPWRGGPVEELLIRWREQGQVLLGGLEGSARSFALARAWLAEPCTWLTVCPTLAMAESLVSDLEFLLGEGPAGPVRLYPAYEVSPYEDMDPPPEVTARRLAVLFELLESPAPRLLVTSARGLSPRLCPPEYLVDSCLTLEPGRSLEREELVAALIRGGYTSVSLVEQVGDFAVRGSVVDFFGPLLDDPVRVEFFGDEIESLRRFDPADQRSQLSLTQAHVIPCHPVDLAPSAVERAVASLRRLAQAQEVSARRLGELIERMETRAPFAGLESLLPFYFDKAADLFSYLPDDRRHCLVEPADVAQRLASEAEELEKDFREAQEEGRPAPRPPMLRRTPGQIQQRLGEKPRLLCKALAMSDEDGVGVLPMRAASHIGLRQELTRGGEGSLLTRFTAWVEEQGQKGRQVVLVCRSRSQAERLLRLLEERSFPARLASGPAEATGQGPGPLLIVVGRLTAGFVPRDAALCLVTEDEVFGAARVVRHQAPPRLSAALAAMDDLAPGDLVVHVDHGVARYEGLVTMPVGPAESDFLLLTYHGGDKLYLPADRMGLISKYRGPDQGRPSLDKLGGKGWQATKRRVKKVVDAIARDLVELYAARRFLKGHSYTPPDRDFREFEAGFPHQETPDQARAIEEVLADLQQPKPMDRLVCGDVGFGKTEVALRAAYLVAGQGRQVAILVPTTVLAEQHFRTISQRLAETPLVVESLSRFKTPAQQRGVLEKLAQGQVDIVVGTHRLIQKDVSFKDLGLVVVDEEHRFGVGDKERLKKLRRLVDVLALTATPIPRTLQMSLSGIRDLSVINTPPVDRQSIETYLAPFSPRALREAVGRELARGGQVFFVHNRVSSIGRMARLVNTLVAPGPGGGGPWPDARGGAGKSDAGLCAPRGGRSGLHHHH